MTPRHITDEYKSKEIISAKNNKFIITIKTKNTGLTGCDDNFGQRDHYKFFNIDEKKTLR